MIDHTKSQIIQKDILLAYWQQTGYLGIMSDLEFSTIFYLPYWDYIASKEVLCDEPHMIVEGCLFVILCMIHAKFDECNNYIDGHLDSIERGISSCNMDVFFERDLMKSCERENAERLLELVKYGMVLVRKNLYEDQFGVESQWAFDNYVKGFFTAKYEN